MAGPSPHDIRSPGTGRGANAAAAILVGGLVAGVLDILYAFVMAGRHGTTPLEVLQSVASGVLGKSAFDGGVHVAALGLLLQIVIATCAATVYFLASRRFSALVQRPFVGGAIFGVCVFLVMTFVIVPLSRAPFEMPHRFPAMARGFVSHAILIGIPIALSVRRFAVRPTADVPA